MIDISGNQVEFEAYIKELIGNIWKPKNKCEYRYYFLSISGSLGSRYLWEDYYKSTIGEEKLIQERKKLIEELENSPDIRLWCMDNIVVRY